MRIEDFQTHFNGHVPGLLGAGSAYAVLVPLVRRRGAAHLLFEVRADTLNRQPGEVCFPGGRIEAGETPTTCALREMEEELSIPPDAVHLLAELDFLYHQSGTLIHPILAEVDAGALRHMRVNTAEVKDTFLVPFSFFLKHKPILYSYDLEPHIPEDFPYHLLGYETGYPWQAGKMDVPIYLYGDHPIWGLTGRICRYLAEEMASAQIQRPASQKKSAPENQYQHIEHPIPALYRADSRILILGSFPSVKSREGHFFYHHPQNRFWRVMAALTGETLPVTIEEKRNLLLRHHIALWDVIHSCDIIASSDSSIKNVLPNDLHPILNTAKIEEIYVNGGTAGRLYRKYIEPNLGRSCTVLPSTSPANAAYSLEKLTALWRAALPSPL